MTMTTKVTQLPYKAPRKHRKPESLRFVVMYTNYTSGQVEFRWFKRDTAACNFLNRMLDNGFDARVLMK